MNTHSNSNTGATDAPVNNQQFLLALTGSLSDSERIWTCTFRDDPEAAQGYAWAGTATTYDGNTIPEDIDANNYYATSTVHGQADGGYRRRITQMHRMYVLVLDDVGVKVDKPSLDPTYIIQTSPGSHQYGYKLAAPISDAHIARRLLHALVSKSSITDKEGNNPVRYVRMPFGSNTKRKYGVPYQHTMTGWNIQNTYSVEEICQAFSLDQTYVFVGESHAAVVPSAQLPTVAPSVALSSYPPTSENKHIVKKMLATFSPDDGIPGNGNRGKWLATIWAVASLGWREEGKELARAWSKRGGLYGDDHQFDVAWQSYDSRPGGITIGTLIKFSTDAGYTGPKLKMQASPTSKLAANDQAADEAAAPYVPDQGDIANGKLFAELHRGKFKYVFARKSWIRWNGLRWEWCDGSEHMHAAKEAARTCARRAARAFAKDPTNSLVKQAICHATRTHDLKRLDAMLVLAASEDGMGISQAALLDADPYLLGVENGVVDLRTGEMVAPDPAMLITRYCEVNYSRFADCPLWKQFLDSCFPGDPDTVHYLQKALGYTLTGNVSEEVLHFCYGLGSNGKSVIANVLYKMMGTYAIVMRTESLMRSRHGEGPTNDIARLQGARLVLANETKTEHCLDDARMKELVSTEAIAARFLHQEFFQFKPTHKIWMRGNHKPRVADSSDGAWRRIRLVPFEVQVSADLADPLLEEKLLLERDGILQWMIQGCKLWQEERLRPSARIHLASNDYRTESDILGNWLAEECTCGPARKVGQKTAWNNYRSWCGQNGHLAGSKNSFTRRLKERDMVAAKNGGAWIYVGLECPAFPTASD